jgi:hypothetical protein
MNSTLLRNTKLAILHKTCRKMKEVKKEDSEKIEMKKMEIHG